MSDYPQRFRLLRDKDTKHVADGVLWPDGSVVLRWRGERPSTAVYDSWESVVRTHHIGEPGSAQWTTAEFLDGICFACGAPASGAMYGGGGGQCAACSSGWSGPPSRKPEKGVWKGIAMPAIATLLLLASCRGADARPDEFSLEVGSGWGDESGQVGLRDFDASGDGQWVALGWTWYLSPSTKPVKVWQEPATPPARAAAALGPAAGPEAPRPAQAQPVALEEPVGEPLPDVPPEEGSWPWAGLPTFAWVVAAGAAGVAGWTYRAALRGALLAGLRWAWSRLGWLLRLVKPARPRARR